MVIERPFLVRLSASRSPSIDEKWHYLPYWLGALQECLTHCASLPGLVYVYDMAYTLLYLWSRLYQDVNLRILCKRIRPNTRIQDQKVLFSRTLTGLLISGLLTSGLLISGLWTSGLLISGLLTSGLLVFEPWPTVSFISPVFCILHSIQNITVHSIHQSYGSVINRIRTQTVRIGKNVLILL